MEGAYAFRYTGGGQQELCQAVTVKFVVMGDSLMVDAAPTDLDTLLHLEIRSDSVPSVSDVVLKVLHWKWKPGQPGYLSMEVSPAYNFLQKKASKCQVS